MSIRNFRLKTIDIAMCINDDETVNFLFPKLDIKDIILITIKEGYPKYFMKYLNLYLHQQYSSFYTYLLCTKFLNICQDINKLIGSFYPIDKIKYTDIHQNIIDDYDSFVMFMKHIYRPNKLKDKQSTKYNRVKSLYSRPSLTRYLMVFTDGKNNIQQMQYLIDHNLVDLNEIRQSNNRSKYRGGWSGYQTHITYKMIKHLL